MTRSAEYRKRWMAISNPGHPCVPRDVEIDDKLGILPTELSLHAAVTVLAGLNGVGKTRLLRLLSKSLGDQGRLIELHALCSAMEQMFRERSDLREATEEAAALQIDDEMLDAIRRIVGRDYDEIMWYGLEFADSPFESVVKDSVVPYFVVTEGPIQYDSREMGLGELAAHVLLWCLWYLRNDAEVVILLDEPDAFFPPSSREPLIDYVGSVALSRRQAFVVTTHSRELIERSLVHDQVLAYMGRVGPAVAFTTEGNDVREVVQSVLYPESALQLVAWVEDDAAHALAGGLLKRLDRPLYRRTVIYWTGGSGDLTALRSRMPRPECRLGSLEFLFAWDGDEVLPEQANSLWPGVLLPGGGASPDALFKQHAIESPEILKAGFDVGPVAVDAALEKAAGLDAHDWTAELVRVSGLSRPETLRVIVDATLAARPAFVDEFRESLVATGLDAVAPLSI